MERAVAIKKLGKLLGKKLAWRINDKAPTAEQRADAKVLLKQEVEARDKIKAQRDARYKAILAADAEYQRLCADYKEVQKNVDQLSWRTHGYKITVGLNEGLFFLVKAEGDSWEEIIDKITAKQAA